MATVSSKEFFSGGPVKVIGNPSVHAESLRSQPEEKKGLFSGLIDSTADDLNEHADKVGQTLAAQREGRQSIPETSAQLVGQGVGLAGDIVGNLIASLTPDAVADPAKKLALAAAKTPLGIAAIKKLQEGTEAFENFKNESDQNARVARDLGALFNIGSAIPTGGGAGMGAKKVAEAAAEGAIDAAKKGAKIGAEAIEAIPSVKEAAGATMVAAGDAIGSKGIRNAGDAMVDTAKVRESLKQEGPSAVRVFDETGTPEFVETVKNTKSKIDLAAKRKMLDVVEERLAGGASTKLPRQVVSDEYVVPRVEALRTRLKALGKTIGDAEQGTQKFQRLDVRDVYDSMVESAKKLGVIVTQPVAGGPLKFTKASGVGGIDASRITGIKTLFEGMTPAKTGSVVRSPAQLAATRKNLSALTKRSDAASEVVSPGGPIDNTRRVIAQKLGDEYYQATKDYSDIARVLEELDPDLKVRLSDASEKEIENIKFADLSRRLLSNNAAKAKSIFKSLDELYQKEMARQGKTVDTQDLEDLVDFAGSLEEGFGIVPRNSFFGQVSGGAADAIGKAAGSIPLTVGGAVSTLADIVKNPKVNNKRALEAMKAYIEDALIKRESE